MSFNKFVTENEIKQPTPTNIVEEWVESLLYRFHKSEETKQYLILKKGVVKEIYDELLPLAKYAKNQYDTPNIFLKFYPGSKNSFDADFVDFEGNILERVEVTMAIDGQKDTIQSEALITYGYSPIFHAPNYSGKSKNRIIDEPESVIIGSSEIISEQAMLLQLAYDNKHSNIHKYPDTTLLIGLDIPLFMDWEYEQIISAFRVHENTFTSIKCVEITSGKCWTLK